MDSGEVRNLYPEVRRQRMLQLVNQAGQATVSELSREFGVSEVTIRTDLQVLAEDNLLVRTHGGAVAARHLPELSLNLRRQQQVAEKDRIGQAAAAMIHNGEAIFLDTSSTSLAIAQNLKRHREVTVITNSLAVSQALVDVTSIAIVMPGGNIQRDTLSLVGVDGLELLQRYNIQRGFFGAHGLSYPEGLTDVSAAEAEVKQRILAMCRQVVAVLDSTKWGRIGVASFARLDEIDTIITDALPSPELAERAQSFGIQIQVV